MSELYSHTFGMEHFGRACYPYIDNSYVVDKVMFYIIITF